MDVGKEALDTLEAEVARVRLQYELFFQGSRRAEPLEERRRLEESIRRIGQRRIINTQDQFRFNGIQARFYSLSNLWARTVREMEEGRLVRDGSGSLVQANAAREEAIAQDHLDRVVEELRQARKECGLPAEASDLETMKDALRVRAGEIVAKSGARTVEFKVSVEDGKPKIKAVVRPGA